MRELSCAIEYQLTLSRIPLRNKASTFDRRHHLTRGPQFARDLYGCGLGNSFDWAVKANLDKDVPFDSIMYEHAAWLLRREHIDHRRDLFILDDDLSRD